MIPAPALLLLGLAAGAQRAETPKQSYEAQQPAIAVPLSIRRGPSLERVRVNVPELSDRLELSTGRRVRFLAMTAEGASLDTRTAHIPLTIAFDAAEAVATPSGKLEIVRTIHLLHEGAEIAELDVKSTIDLFGLADEAPHVTVIDARVERLAKGAALFAEAKLAGGGVIATPVFPLELVISKRDARPEDQSTTPASTRQ